MKKKDRQSKDVGSIQYYLNIFSVDDSKDIPSEEAIKTVSSDITSQELLELGFEKKYTSIEVEPGSEDSIFYWVYEFGHSGLILLTNECSDEVVEEKGWSVSFLEYEKLTFTSIQHVQNIIYSIENRKINE